MSPAFAPNKDSFTCGFCSPPKVMFSAISAGTSVTVFASVVNVASASAPRASLTPTTISARLQSSSAPCGAAAGTPDRSKFASSFKSA